MKVGLFVCDTETTGLDSTTTAVPWEVGWVAGVHDFDTNTVACRTPQQFQLHLTEEQMLVANPAALRIGKFQERYTYPEPENNARMKAAMIADCIKLAEETRQLPQFTGANPTFDMMMLILGGTFSYAQWNNNFTHRLMDVQALAAGALKLNSMGLNRIAEHFGIVQEGAHEALDDALVTMRCYAACYGATLILSDVPPARTPVVKPRIDLSEDW